MDAGFLLAFSVILFLIYKILRLWDEPRVPQLKTSKDSKFVNGIIKECPILFERYVPTPLWGKSGHLQTMMYAKMGRFECPTPFGERISIQMSDGATNTFDVFEPLATTESGEPPILLVCPGIGNNSETSYIRTLVDCMQKAGWRVVILNHLGALYNLKITSPRIFNYGCTKEWHAMVQWVRTQYPTSPLLMCGISMGANIVLKYLGEDHAHQRGVLAALSVCQAYDVMRAKDLLHRWEHMRRGYLYLMCEAHKRMLRNHGDVLFSPEARRKLPEFDEKQLWRSTSLFHVDSSYHSKVNGFSHVHDYYRWSSSANYMNNIQIPLLLLNAEDDPIVPTELLDIPTRHVETHADCLFVLSRHGGHLGFFEGGVVRPAAVTWLDRLVLQYCTAVVKTHRQDEQTAGCSSAQ